MVGERAQGRVLPHLLRRSPSAARLPEAAKVGGRARLAGAHPLAGQGTARAPHQPRPVRLHLVLLRGRFRSHHDRHALSITHNEMDPLYMHPECLGLDARKIALLVSMAQ